MSVSHLLRGSVRVAVSSYQLRAGITHVNNSISTLLVRWAMVCAACTVLNTHAAEAVGEVRSDAIEALMAGKPHVQLRYRFEHVDDDLVPANDAAASTLRIALGWETGVWRGFSAYAEMEHVAQLFIDDYKEGPGPLDPTKAGLYPVVADPAGTELNQAYVRFNGYDWLDVTIGRQDITYRKAPFHRFIGNVLWRQNWQTYDAATFKLEPAEDFTFSYAFVNKVNRIFGDDAPGPFDVFDCDCHLLNAGYDGFDYLQLETYAYLLKVENAQANSTHTFGLRASGAYPLNEQWRLVYAAEFAEQSDSGANPTDIDANYYLGEAGLSLHYPTAVFNTLTVKFDYEVLEGDGRGSFITPLATAHAFQGWADRFLTTPADGIEDFYITMVAGGVFGGRFVVSYHMLESDHMNYAYGDELNVLYARKFREHFTIGAKAAFYSADRNRTALARAGGGQNNDVTKAWVWLQFDY